MKIYLSGLISNGGKLPKEKIKENIKVFFKAEKFLKDEGCEIINPPRMYIAYIINMPWTKCISRNIGELLDCDKICLLPNWQISIGSRIELAIANELNLEIIYYNKTDF